MKMNKTMNYAVTILRQGADLVINFWSKGISSYLLTMVGLVFVMMTVFNVVIPDQNQPSVSNGTALYTPGREDVVINHDVQVENQEKFNSKFNELDDEDIAYLLRIDYKVYIIENYTHLQSQNALEAQANGELAFVNPENRTIWCSVGAPEGVLLETVSQFIEDHINGLVDEPQLKKIG